MRQGQSAEHLAAYGVVHIDTDSNDGDAQTIPDGSEAFFFDRLFIGDQRRGTLIVRDNCSVHAQRDVFIGRLAESNGKLELCGRTTWENHNSGLYLGIAGRGELTIADGGSLITRSAYIGPKSGVLGCVGLESEGTSWTCTGSLGVGLGAPGILTVARGAAVAVSGALSIGEHGQITLDGGFVRADRLEIEGGIVHHQSGNLVVDGHAQLGGTLSLANVDVDPTAGEVRIRILTCKSYSRRFTEIEAPPETIVEPAYSESGLEVVLRKVAR